MTENHVALYTFGIFAESFGSPVNDGFHARNDINFAAAERSAGFIARSGYEGDPGPQSWGEHAYPRFYTGVEHSPSTLSLWQDLTSPMAFAYCGIHAEAMRHGREWFVTPQWPGYVLWWVDHDHRPDWAEAVARHEYLHDHGATAHAFTFKQAFDADNRAVTIDRHALKAIIEVNQLHDHSLTANG